MSITHAEFQQQVVDLAHALGWRHLHVRRTVGRGKKWTTSTNVVGWPDLQLWKPGRGFVFLELKTDGQKATPEQEAVLADLGAAGARAALVVWPRDLENVRDLLQRLNADVTLALREGMTVTSALALTADGAVEVPVDPPFVVGSGGWHGVAFADGRAEVFPLRAGLEEADRL